MLHGAATALDLTRTGKIFANGTLGPLLTSHPQQPVYDGDRPRTEHETRLARQEALCWSWAQLHQAIEETIGTARSDPATARDLLRLLTFPTRTPDAYERERRFLIGLGIPTAFLPADADQVRVR